MVEPNESKRLSKVRERAAAAVEAAAYRDGCIKTQKLPKEGEKMRVISYWKASRVIKHQTMAFSVTTNFGG